MRNEAGEAGLMTILIIVKLLSGVKRVMNI